MLSIRPTRAKLEADIRDALAKRGVPTREDVIDGPPMFDAFHEACIARVVDDMTAMWDYFEKHAVIVDEPEPYDAGDLYIDLGGES